MEVASVSNGFLIFGLVLCSRAVCCLLFKSKSITSPSTFGFGEVGFGAHLFSLE
jgi:hypothetical protein